MSTGCGDSDLHFVTIEYSVSWDGKLTGIGIVIVNLIEHEQVSKDLGSLSHGI